jgi:hypothetical protein
MKVRMLIGRSLMGLGLLLMVIGTLSVRSTTWAAGIPVAPCNAGCNECGTPQEQDDESWECLKKQGDIVLNGSCDTNPNSATCTGCAGGCTAKKFQGVRSCVCDI